MANQPKGQVVETCEDQLRRVERVARLGFWEWDRRSGHVFWSQGTYRVFGREPATFAPSVDGFLGTLHPDDRQAMAATLEHALATGTPYSESRRVIWDDGSVHWVQCEGEPMLDDAGEVVGLFGTAQDVTVYHAATEQVAASERMFRRLADSLPALIAYVDAGQRYQFVNPIWEQWHGLRADTVLGRPVREVMNHAVRKRFGPYLKAALAGEPQSFEMKFDYRGVGSRYIHVNYVPDIAADRSVAGVFALITDLTEQRRAEEALQEQAEALTEADRRKDDFLAMLGHELRNPLTPIRNATAVLNQQHGTMNAERVAWATRIIEGQADHLIALTDDLLDVARISQGRIRLRTERVDLREVVTKAAETVRPLTESREQTLIANTPETPLPVEGDPVRLVQIVDNLLGNAVRYTDAGGEIAVSAAMEGGQAVLRVVDTGAGIPEELLPRVFERFTRGTHHRAPHHEGLGLGLHLCKYLAERQGGTIDAHSAGVGQGAAFRMLLPLAEEPPAPEVPGRAAPEDYKGHPCRVLVVDDNDSVAESTSILLQSLGHESRIAADGRTALDVVESFLPDVLLLDIGLPGMDGYEVARQLRQKHPKGELMLVALTGYGQESDRQAAEAAGFDRHVTKPVSPSELTELLRAARHS